MTDRSEPGEPQAPSVPESPSTEQPDLLTIRVRRSHLNVAAALFVGFLAGFWLSQLVDEDVIVPNVQNLGAGIPSPASLPPQTNVKVPTEGRPAKGPKDAKVTIVEYTDYQCPFCKRHVDEVLPALLKGYRDEVRYVVKNLPVAEIHPFAQKAAEAAECAFDQGQDTFWRMHDSMFKDQSALAVDDLKKQARSSGLEGPAFDSCLDDGRTASIVQKEVTEAKAFGITGTPTFVINGTVYKGAANLPAFKSRIDLASQQARNA